MGRELPSTSHPSFSQLVSFMWVFNGYVFSGVDLSQDGNVQEDSRCEVRALNFGSCLCGS